MEPCAYHTSLTLYYHNGQTGMLMKMMFSFKRTNIMTNIVSLYHAAGTSNIGQNKDMCLTSFGNNFFGGVATKSF